MHVKSLKVFCDVVSRRSFSRAAADNNISQSGASQMVQQLEDRLGLKLIDRSTRPFELTPAGQVYYDGCRKLVKSYFSLEEEVLALEERASAQVRIASIYSIGLSNLNGFVQEFSKENPDTKVCLDYQHPAKVRELLENDEIDLGLLSYPKSSRTIDATPWCEDSLVVVCAADHPFAERDSVRLAELNGLDFVAFDRDMKLRRELDRVFANHHVRVNVMLEFDNIETLKRGVEISAGVSLLPRPTVEREVAAGLLAAAELQDLDLKRPLGVIQRRGKELGTAAQAFLDFLLKKADETGKRPKPVDTKAKPTEASVEPVPDAASVIAEA